VKKVSSGVKKVFISHVSEEKSIARVLRKFLRSGLSDGGSTMPRQEERPNPFLSENLQLGRDWFVQLRRELDRLEVILVVCSQYSVEQRWINFETGYGWRNRRIVPICHTDQKINHLPPPFTNLQGLEVGDEELPTRLAEICGREPPPSDQVSQINEELRAAEREVIPPVQTIDDRRERTKQVNTDLKQLFRTPNLRQQKVRHSAFLSTFAIGPHDRDDRSYLDLLQEERDLLLGLARQGCTIDCLISPANENYFISSGRDYAMRGTEELLRFLGSSHAALKHINWAIAETGLPNRFIIGNISYFEGYKTSTESSYAITRRYRAPDVLEFNTQRFDEDFSGWQRLNLLKWRKEGRTGSSAPIYSDRPPREFAKLFET